MIVFILGTTAEAIKIAPIVRRLDAQGIPYQLWLTLQHTAALRKILPSLGFHEPDEIIANGKNGSPLRSAADAVHWLVAISAWSFRRSGSLRRGLPKNSIIVVHGDTMTSVVGALIAKRLGLRCAHVEAGLRSGNWRHPFPEELDRRIVGKLAAIHYTPSEEATQNLRSRVNVVWTHGNTAIDAVLDQPKLDNAVDEKYGVVLLHRYEFLANRELVASTLKILASETPIPLHFFVDEYAKETLSDILPKANSEKIRIQDKLNHEDFIALLRNSEFIVTDSGGIQAEAALLGTPTLIHRMATEQREGLGENISLSGWDTRALSTFLRESDTHRRPASRPEFSPSDIIVEDLLVRISARGA